MLVVPETQREPESDPPPDQLLRRLEDERDRRWVSGERVLAETYLEAHPSLSTHQELVVRLVYGEYLLREELGETPDPDEYVRRFPHLADRLSRQIALHLALARPKHNDSDRSDPSLDGDHTGANVPVVPGYAIEGELGRGGMAIVYRARDTALNRVVALKVIKTESLPSPEEADRFRSEAEAVARLHHPHIVQVFDVGEVDGRPYMALEFVPGGTLAGRLQTNPLTPVTAAGLIEVLARAVDRAHKAGVVHRDLKPGNVLLADDGSPRVADFGLAKRLDAPEGHTCSGVLLGTPNYMSPEQASGHANEVGPTADVYALGAILYECLTGSPPFKGSSLFETLSQVCLKDPVPPSKFLLRLSRDLEAVCLRCLEKEPARRYPTAMALADDLRRWLDGRPTQARPRGPVARGWKLVRRNPVVSTATAVTVLAIAIGIVAAFLSERKAGRAREGQILAEAREENEKTLRAANEQVLVVTKERAEFGRRAECSRKLALSDRLWGNNFPGASDDQLDDCPPDLRGFEWHHRRHRGQPDGLAFKASWYEVGGVAASPDGKWIATVDGVYLKPGQEGVVKLWDAATGRLVKQLGKHTESGHGVAFHPSRAILVTSSYGVDASAIFKRDAKKLRAVSGELYVWDLATQQLLRTLSDCVGPIAFDASGSRLACTGSGRAVRVWRTDGTEWIEPVEFPAYTGVISSVAISRDGGLVAVSGMDVTWTDGIPKIRFDLLVYDTVTGRKVFEPKDAMQSTYRLAFAPDGRTLAAGGEGKVLFHDLETGETGPPMLGHDNSVLSLTFNANGTRLATGSVDQTVKLWDVAERRELRTFRGHDRAVNTVAFGPPVSGAEPLMSGGADGVVRVWDPRRDGESLEFSGHGRAANAVAFSPDRDLLASSSQPEGRIMLWDPATQARRASLPGLAEHITFGPRGLFVTAGGARGDLPGQLLVWQVSDETASFPLMGRQAVVRRKFSLVGHTLYVTAVAVSPDGRFIASAGGNVLAKVAELVRVWDAATGKELFHFKPEIGVVIGLAFSPDGTHLAVSGMDKAVAICDSGTGQEIRRLTGHPDKAMCVAYSPDGATIASGDSTGVVILWNAADGRQLRVLEGQNRLITAVAFDGRGRLASASYEPFEKGRGEVKVWDISDGREVMDLPGQSGVAFSRDGKMLAAPARGSPLTAGLVRVWEAPPSPKRATIRKTAKALLAVAADPVGQRFAYEDAELDDSALSIVIADAVTRRTRVRIVDAHPDGATVGLAFSPREDLLASASSYGHVRLWNASTGKLVREYAGNCCSIHCLCFDSTGNRLLTASDDKTARVWDVNRLEPVLELTHPDKAFHVAISPDGRFIATACADRNTRIWDATTGVLLHTIPVPTGAYCVAFGPDGLLVTGGGNDRTIRLWDARTAEPLGSLVGHTDAVRDLAFDGGVLISVSTDQTARTWDLAARKPLGVFRGHLEMVRCVAAADGWFVTGGFDGTVRLWDTRGTER